MNKKIENIYKNFDISSKNLIIKIIGFVSLICSLFWWVPFISSIGMLIRGDYNEASIHFLVFIAMLIFWRGGGEIIEKNKNIFN